MNYSGDARELGRNGTGVQRAANDAKEFIVKTATTFAKGKSPEAPTTPAMAAAGQVRPLEAVVPQSVLPGSGPSIVSLRVEVTGSITSPDEVHIYGRIEGNIRAASLTICEGGSVKGDVVAETVSVHGSLEGRIFAQNAQLFGGAMVRGDIIHGSLGIDRAAIFEGVSKRSENPISDAPDAKA
jgi:cytoskeletal protein CcmA (bactofilin family)